MQQIEKGRNNIYSTTFLTQLHALCNSVFCLVFYPLLSPPFTDFYPLDSFLFYTGVLKPYLFYVHVVLLLSFLCSFKSSGAAEPCVKLMLCCCCCKVAYQFCLFNQFLLLLGFSSFVCVTLVRIVKSACYWWLTHIVAFSFFSFFFFFCLVGFCVYCV